MVFCLLCRTGELVIVNLWCMLYVLVCVLAAVLTISNAFLWNNNYVLEETVEPLMKNLLAQNHPSSVLGYKVIIKVLLFGENRRRITVH